MAAYQCRNKTTDSDRFSLGCNRWGVQFGTHHNIKAVVFDVLMYGQSDTVIYSSQIDDIHLSLRSFSVISSTTTPCIHNILH